MEWVRDLACVVWDDEVLYYVLLLIVIFLCSWLNVYRYIHATALYYELGVSVLNFKRRIKSHLPFAGITRSSPDSPR